MKKTINKNNGGVNMKKRIIICLALFLTVGFVIKVGLAESKNVEFDHSTDHIINPDGSHTLILYSGIRNVFEDGKWKRIENAKSLKDYFSVVYLEDDPKYKIDVIDFNYTSIKFEVSVTDLGELQKSIPVILYNLNESFDYSKFIEKEQKEPTWNDTYYIVKSENKEFVELNTKHNIKYSQVDGFNLGSIIKFGEKSTTIKLQENGTENVDDTEAYGQAGYQGYNFGAFDHFDCDTGGAVVNQMRPYIKWNISAVPSGQTIDNAILGLYEYSNRAPITCDVHHVYSNVSWKEGNGSMTDCSNPINCNYGITWYTQPCGDNYTGLDNASNCNLTKEDSMSVGATIGWKFLNVANMVRNEYEISSWNVSMHIIQSPPTASKGGNFYSKEYTTDITLRPFLNITYSAALSYATETQGDDAIERAINSSLTNPSKYSDQQVYARSINNNQDLGRFDWFVVQTSPPRRWAINYVTTNDPTSGFTSMFNITPVFSVLELDDMTEAEITDAVGDMINGTK